MFFIIGSPNLNETFSNQPNDKSFSIAQACLNETDPVQAKVAGIYKMRLWTQQLQDNNTRSLSQSRFYPALRSINQTTNKYHPTRPDKVAQVLANDPTLSWPYFDVPLAEVCIAGPFNFTQQRIGLKGPKRLAVSETHHIDRIYWQQLEERGGAMGIMVDNIWITPHT